MWRRLVVTLYGVLPPRLRRIAMGAATPRHGVGVFVVMRRPDGRVLLVDQRYNAGWSLPGGALKRGESLTEAASRELTEEIGIVASCPLPVVAHHRASHRWVTFVTYLDVDDETANAVTVSSHELAAASWFAVDSLPPLAEEAQPVLAREIPIEQK